ncbi:MAG: hypothetical protein CR972_01965 [Candidatus Moraniibacteriota bacterium]|nr:MAG: hypothetical protein CR972_01965 [Candidatus Moranbacteria bacterium]
MKVKQKLTQLFNPQSIAVIGASSTKGKVGNMIAKNILAHNYSGNVYFVNPKRSRIFGRKCYKSLSDVENNVDCAIVVVPAKYVVNVVRDSVSKCKNFIVISAGFGESGSEGHNREIELNLLAKELDIQILGPNCLGFLAPSLGLNASFAEGLPVEGHTAFISQSGALAVAMMDKARADHMGFSLVVSIGNKMQIGAADIIDYLIEDKKTKVIALYLEGVIRGRYLLKVLARAYKAGKKVVVLKSGHSEDAQRAIALHTGSLAGSDEIFSAAIEKVGAIRAQTMDELFALMLFGAYCDVKTFGSRVSVVTNAGGPGVLAADIVADLSSLEMNVFASETKKKLQKKLPVAASVHNPVDLLGDANIDRYREGLKIVLADEKTDVVLVLLTPQDQTPVDLVAELLVEVQKKSKKMILTSFIGGVRVANSVQYMRENGVLHFDTPQRALSALASFVKEKKVFMLTEKSVNRERRIKTRQIIDRGFEHGGLYFADVAEIAKIYSVPIVKFVDVTNGLDAQTHIKYPCVAKIDNPKIAHKTDRGGVIASIKTLIELDQARKTLLRKFPEKNSRVIVQKMLPIETELIIGMKKDPVFDTVIVAGLGGVYVEVFHAVDHYVTPLSITEIKKILTTGALAFLFDGTRGEKSYDSDMIAHVIQTLALIGRENPEIIAIDINPLLVYNNDAVDTAVDFKIIIKNT